MTREPEIERSLTLVREDTEREIADHRLRLYAFCAVLVLLVKLWVDRALPWTPPLMLTTGALLAWGQRVLLHRQRYPSWAIVLGSVVDLVLVAAIFVLSQPPQAELDITREWLGVHAVGFACLLTIGSLRLSVLTATLTTLAASALYLLTACWLVGPRPAFFVVAGMMLFMIWFARTVIRRTERNLELFARYQQLRRFLPATAVERVLNEDLGEALAVGGRSVEVTLLATDLRDFTAMSEKLAPEEVVRQLNAYHAVMLEQIDRFGGSLDKFIGDGSLVVFGLTSKGAADAGAQAAVDCAQAMLVALEGLNAQRAASGLPALRMGLGLHTGPVVAGNIGAPGRRLEFTVIGDAVNTASRLEGATKSLGRPLVISRTTVSRLGDRAGLVELPPVQLRGREEALQVFAPKEAGSAIAGSPPRAHG